jgi:hypothetical protein
MLVTLEGIVMLFRLAQSRKVSLGITVALESMMTLCTLLKLLKAETTLELGGIVMLVKPVQPSKANDPMLVTLEGIVMLVNPVQPEKASPPMLVTPEGIVMLSNPVQ